MKIKDKIIVNTAAQIFGKIASIFLSFISIFLLTRYLGVSGYGKYSLVFIYLSFFAFLSDMGLSLLVVRDVSNNKVKLEESLSLYISIKLILTVFATISAILILFFFPYSDEIKIAILIGSVAVAVGSINSFGMSFLQAQMRMDLVTIIDQSTKFITVLFILIFVLLKLSFFFIVSSVFLGNVIGFLITFFLLKNKLKLFKNFNLQSFRNIKINKHIVRECLLVGIMSLFAFTYFKIDSLILSVYKSSSDLGVYTLAYKIIENILLFWGFYMASIYPLFSKFNVENQVKYRQIFNNSIWLSFMISFVCIYFGFFHASTVIQILGGSNFYTSILPLKILIFSIPFFLINNIFYHSFISKNKIRQVIICILFTLIINATLNIIYVPKYSYLASSYITLVTEIILLLCYTIYNYIALLKNKYEK
jgi:O-antigen/teichoic acid export membrane protein